MKRKILAVLLTIGLAAGLSACGSSGGTAETNSAQTDTGSQAAEASSGDTSGGAAVKVGICLPIRDQYWTTFEQGLNENLDAAGIEYQTVVAGDQGEDVST